MDRAEQIEALRAMIETQATIKFENDAARWPSRTVEEHLALHKMSITTMVKPGRKYTKIDVGTSGRYMVELSTGIIFGIKAYGQVHKGHCYGTLETISDWYWGDYTAEKRDQRDINRS